ncbi:MAG: PAS domain S-box protein [Bryobacterales bacterium]|nr:PAS domain S-box protein [Bryobacterales bacterium]
MKETLAMRLAWWPVFGFIIALLILWAADSRAEYGSPFLLFALNFVCSALTSLFVVFLISRSFLLRGSISLLLTGCGVLLWGIGSVISVVVDPYGVNSTITIHNICAWLAALFFLSGALISLRGERTVVSSRTLIVACYLSVLGLILFICHATVTGHTPVFFVQGTGGTPIRQLCLGSAVVMFAATAVLLRLARRKSDTAFLYWYTLAVALIATGLLGVLLQSSFGSPLNWTARAAMLTAGVYMFLSALASMRETENWEVSLTAALSHARQRYADLFQLAADGVLVHEFSGDRLFGRIHEANPAMCALVGYTAEQLRAAPPPTIVAPASDRPVHQTAAAGRREVVLVNSAGNSFTAEISTRVFVRNGVRFGLSVVRDVTARRRAEDQLRELAQRLTYHVDNSPLAVVEWGPDMRISRWSGEAERMFGWTSAEVLGKSIQDLHWIHAEDEHAVVEMCADLQRGTSQSHSSNRNHHKDGSVLYCEWYNSCLRDEHGNLRSILSLVLDVTARTLAEHGLRRVNAELEQFAYAASHDLQEPLRNISLFAQLLESSYANVLDERGAEYLRYVTSGVHRINDLLSSLRAYLQLGDAPSEVRPVDARSIVGDVLQTLHQAIVAEQATVTVGDLPPVAVDPVHLQQLFQNLIGNALKFRSTAAPEIHISAVPHGSNVRFCVKDNGIGIDRQYARQIFGVFKRLHSHAKIPGSGIGLAICHKIVERYNGTIHVESAPGQGASFYFSLPAAAPANARK